MKKGALLLIVPFLFACVSQKKYNKDTATLKWQIYSIKAEQRWNEIYHELYEDKIIQKNEYKFLQKGIKDLIYCDSIIKFTK
jgi:hypothetical protein